MEGSNDKECLPPLLDNRMLEAIKEDLKDDLSIIQVSHI
jgi:hypothetical protein